MRSGYRGTQNSNIFGYNAIKVCENTNGNGNMKDNAKPLSGRFLLPIPFPFGEKDGEVAPSCKSPIRPADRRAAIAVALVPPCQCSCVGREGGMHGGWLFCWHQRLRLVAVVVPAGAGPGGSGDDVDRSLSLPFVSSLLIEFRAGATDADGRGRTRTSRWLFFEQARLQIKELKLEGARACILVRCSAFE